MVSKEIEKEIIKLRKQGYSRNEISAVLHLGHNTVQQVLNKYNLTARQGFDIRKKEIKKKIKKKKRQIKTSVSIGQEIEIPKTEKKAEKKKEKIFTTSKANYMFYGYIHAKIQEGMFILRVNISTKWSEDIELATKMIYDKCSELSRKYKAKIVYASIVKVKYVLKNNKIHVLERQEYIDMTQNLQICLKALQNSRW